MADGLLRTLTLTLVAVLTLPGALARAAPVDPKGADPLRVSLTTGFSHRTAEFIGAVGDDPLQYGGVTPPPTARLSAAWFFLNYLGVVADVGGEWFSVGPPNRASLDEPTRRLLTARFSNTWNGALGVAGRLSPVSLLAIELHLGWALRGESQVRQLPSTGKVFENNTFHQGPYGTLTVGIYPTIPVSGLIWARAAPFAVHHAFANESNVDARGARSGWYAFGLEVAAGRLKLSSLRASLLLQYELNLRRTEAPNGYIWWDRTHNFGLGVRVSLPGPPVDDGTQVVEPTPTLASIAGTVVGEDEVPVWKAKVSVNGGAAIETDSQGQFSVSGVAAGAVSLSTSAEGFKPTTEQLTVTGGEQATAKVVLKRPSGPGKVKGKVVLSDPERPASGAEISLESGRKVVAADDGSYLLDDVGPGPVALKVSAVGYLPADELVVVPAEGEATLDVKLSNKRPNAVLRGKVSVKEGTLVSATVKVKQKNITVPVGADGRFLIELPGGRYEVVVEAPGYRTQTRTIDVGYGDQTIFHFELRPASR